jgi:ribonuclease R
MKKDLILKLTDKLPTKLKLNKDEYKYLKELLKEKIIIKDDDFYYISSKYRVGSIDIIKDNKGYLNSFDGSNKDILIESANLNGARDKDIVICKRVFSKSSTQTGRVVQIIEHIPKKIVALIKDENQTLKAFDIQKDVKIPIKIDAKYKKDTVILIDEDSGKIHEILGNINDPRVDEKISLNLFHKSLNFPYEVNEEVKNIKTTIYKKSFPNRLDLTDLSFCTIDPPTAKDHDDAIYFDKKNHTLYVAIADVSHYVTPSSHIDIEAKSRGFSIYFPHKSIPMLPRELSENMCSLKPNVNRLAYCFIMQLDKKTLEVKNSQLKEVIIKSQKKYSYDKVDEFLDGKLEKLDKTDKIILDWLLPLAKITDKLKKDRLQNGFDFRNDETKIELDNDLNIIKTSIEESTPSHSLIEDCMLLANKESAKILDGLGIFRTHLPPTIAKVEELLNELATIGIFAKQSLDFKETITSIQKEADEKNISKFVDKLIIKAQQQATYTHKNQGHFGLGFDQYSHFTSPIRRYSDLILHRILKALATKDNQTIEYIFANIVPICVKISDLERNTTKVAQDYENRKFARWANKNIGNIFNAIVTSTEPKQTAHIENENTSGAKIRLEDESIELFEKIKIKITSVNIATKEIFGVVVKEHN